MQITREFLFHQYVTLCKSQRQIADELNVSLGTIEQTFKKLDLIGIRKTRYSANEILFDLNNDVFCYLLGLLSADSYFDNKNKRTSLRLHNNDSNILYDLKKYFSITTPIGIYNDSTDLTIYSEKLLDIAKEIRINVNNRKFNMELPELNDIQFKYFLRGYLDGDGNIRDKGFRFTTGSVLFVNSIINRLNLIFNLNIKLTYQKTKSDKSLPKLEISSYKGNELLVWIYSDRPKLAIQRKRNRALKINDDIV